MPDDSFPRPPRGATCPICGNPRAREWRPFCSRRCADVDLGRWLGGRYVVPSEPTGAPDDGDPDPVPGD